MKDKTQLEVNLQYIAKNFLNEIKGKHLDIISHFDTDGITSAAIMIQSLKKIDQEFSLKIVKSLNKEIIKSLNPENIILFLDLASANLKQIEESNLKKVYIIDHHEITNEIPPSINIINPEIFERQKISASGLTYLFCKEIDEKNKEFGKLAILGMIGDQLEKEIDILNYEILEENEIKRKKGVLIYPSTRPLNIILEYSSEPYIPDVTGNIRGVLELLREAKIFPEGGKYKSIIDLNEEEMKRLVTSIILRKPKIKDKELIGDLFLIKMFGKLEDAREISAKINACSRNGKPEVALGLCLENLNSKKQAESIHLKHKQSLISGLKQVEEMKKIEGEGFIILNAKETIKDTMIGTIASILANSSNYEPGTIIIAMATDIENKKIKISARNAGKSGRNVHQLLLKIITDLNGEEVGGHEFAAGCSIEIEQEDEFISKIKKSLEIELVKI